MGVRLDSPSRDAASWLFSRFIGSAETWRRFGWSRKMFIRCSSSEIHFAVLRKVMAHETQEALSRKAWKEIAASASVL